MRQGLTILLVLAAIGVGAMDSRADTLTGAELATDARVTFPAGSRTLTGTAMDFDPTADLQVAMRIPIVAAGVIGLNDPKFTIQVTVDMTRLSGDWDPIFALSDGGAYVGLMMADNSGGQVISAFGGEYGTSYDYQHTRFVHSGSGAPGIGERILVTYEWELQRLRTDLSVAWSTFDFNDRRGGLNRPNGLDLVLLADNSVESYRIHSITFPGSGSPVPEPSTFTLAAAGIGLAWVRRRRSLAS